MLRFRFSLSQLIGAILVLVVVLSPFIFNLALNTRSLVPGMLLGQIVALLFLAYGHNLNFRVPSFFLVGFGGFVIFLFLNEILFSHGQVANLIVFLTLIVLLSVNGSQFARRILHKPDYWTGAITWAYFSLIALAAQKIAFGRSSVLLIGEPSYLALIAGPLALVSYSLNRSMGPANVFILLALGFLLPNATCLLFCMIQIGWIIVGMKFKAAWIPLFALLAASFELHNQVLNNDYFASRLTVDAASANLSSLMFLANWQDAISRVTSIQVFGSGIGSAAENLSNSNDFEYEIALRYGTGLTYTSGTFWFARGIQTIGFAALAVVLLLLWKAIVVLRHAGWRFRNLHWMGHLELTMYSAMLPELFFRSASLLGPAAILFFVAINLSRWSVKVKSRTTSPHHIPQNIKHGSKTSHGGAK